ncbi:hypothetical protein VTJ83DRAFT_1827 [Remersonia thermophila]|uniref:Peptidase A1 domain-containing protein n=1 Tax=Remersonia thermophila TaxID=72144 RepID=A0ABR4DH16_9PEZI
MPLLPRAAAAAAAAATTTTTTTPTALLLLLLLLLLTLAPGASSHRHVVELSVSRAPTPELPGPGLALALARRATYAEDLINYIAGGGYYVQVAVGNPPQNLTMLLDTGSSDSWVLGHDADICNSPDLQAIYGSGACIDTFNPSGSSTARMIKREGFRITYLDGRSASGHYIADDLSIGGATVRALQMAYVTRAVRTTGILGLGFSVSERAATKYPNLMDELFNQRSIGCKAYSLYLNDRRTDAGSILFGGVDTDKFIGTLDVLPLQRPPGSAPSANISSFEVDFDSVSLAFTNGTADLVLSTSLLDHPAPAVLDSGSTLSYIPDKLAQPIFSALGAVFDPVLNLTLVDCAYAHADGAASSPSAQAPLRHVTFAFPPSTRILVPLWSLVLDILPAGYAPPLPDLADPATQYCVFGLQSTALLSSKASPKNNNNGTKGTEETRYTLLGDTFLRSAYVVYDLTHAQIGLAQANLNSTSSSVVELSADSDGLPKLTGVAAQQTTFTPTPTARPLGNGHGNGNGAKGGEKNAAGRRPGGDGAGNLAVLVGVALVTALWTAVGSGAFLAASFCSWP